MSYVGGPLDGGEQQEGRDAGAEQLAAPVVPPVITLDNYFDHFARLTLLMALDPAPDTPEGRELVALGHAIQEYERGYLEAIRQADGDPMHD